jgi:hypothetical protein
LTFANHLYYFDSRNNHTRGRRRSWTLHRAQASFNMAVVGFDAIIRVALGSMSTAVAELAFLLQFPNGGRITAQSVSRKNMWQAVVGIGQRSLQEALRSFPIPSFR